MQGNWGLKSSPAEHRELASPVQHPVTLLAAQAPSQGRRIIESSMLEDTSKIKSNRHPIITMPTKPCSEVPYLHIFLNTSRHGDSTTSLGSLFQYFTTRSVKEFFLTSNLNLPWHNLRPFPLILSLVTWEKSWSLKPQGTFSMILSFLIPPPWLLLEGFTPSHNAFFFCEPLNWSWFHLNHPTSTCGVTLCPFLALLYECLVAPLMTVQCPHQPKPQTCSCEGCIRAGLWGLRGRQLAPGGWRGDDWDCRQRFTSPAAAVDSSAATSQGTVVNPPLSSCEQMDAAGTRSPGLWRLLTDSSNISLKMGAVVHCASCNTVSRDLHWWTLGMSLRFFAPAQEKKVFLSKKPDSSRSVQAGCLSRSDYRSAVNKRASCSDAERTVSCTFCLCMQAGTSIL